MMWWSQSSTAHAILSSQASNFRTNSGVQTIGLSSLHLPWSSANFVIHSYNSTRREQKKILCISIYKYFSNHCSFVNHGFLFSFAVNLWIFLSNQYSTSFLVGFQWCDITHLVMQIQILAMEPFVALMGPDLGSALFNQENPYTTCPFCISPQSADQSLTRSSMGGVQEPSFHTLR